MCVQKVAGASPDRWRQCVKEDPPWSMGQCLVFLCHPPITRRPSTMSPWQTSCPASAAELLLDRGACRLQASGDSTGGRARSRMTKTTVRARRVGRPSSSAEWWTVSVSSVQDTICSRHNLLRHVSQDTICSRHNLFKTRFTRHDLFKTHFTMLHEPELPEHEVQEPEDEHERGKPRHDLFKTQSVQDTICQDTFHKTQSVQDTIFFLKYTPCQLLRLQ